MTTTADAPLFDPRLALFLVQLGQMAEYFDKRFIEAHKAKITDPLVEYEIYDEVTQSIYKMQNDLSRLIGEDVRINTFTKQLKGKKDDTADKES